MRNTVQDSAPWCRCRVGGANHDCNLNLADYLNGGFQADTFDNGRAWLLPATALQHQLMLGVIGFERADRKNMFPTCQPLAGQSVEIPEWLNREECQGADSARIPPVNFEFRVGRPDRV